MLKQNLVACAIAALIAGPAFAQTTQPVQPAQPSAKSPDLTKTAPAAGKATQKVEYITRAEPDLVRGTKLDGVNVYNDQNERIGDIKEVLLDKQGKARAVVIGVGGFLGIGERDVAVPFEALQWQMTADTRATTAPATTTPPATTTGQSTTGQATTTAPATPPARTTGATGTSATMTDRSVPARAILPGATKEQLKQAPEYKYPS